MAHPPSTILLSGASGMLGTALREAFAVRDVPVRQLVRRTASAPDQVQWNPAASPAIQDARTQLGGLAAAIHLSGANVAAHRWTDAYKSEIRRSRVQSTRALAETLAGLPNPPRVLLTASATGIYGNRGDEVLDESSAPGSGFLAGLCEEWEAAAQPAAAAGIRVVHLRFGVVVGRDGALKMMLPVFRFGLGGRLGSGRQWMSWISLADAVAANRLALTEPRLTGAVNLTAPNPVTNAEFTQTLARTLHRPAILPVPAFALRLAMGEMADEALLSSARVMPAKLMRSGFEFAEPTLEQALAAAVGSRQ